MGREYKTSFRMYSAWNYELEIESLNKASEQGWQLVKGGCFSSRFRRNPGVRYRYQLDYQPKIEDMGRYIETFREQGWEYVNSTFNGWRYFRKPYDPSLPEDQYHIFTDRSSLKEMNRRWVKLATVLSVAIVIFILLFSLYCVFMPMLPTLIQIITLAAVLLVLVYGIVIMKNPEKSKNKRWDSALLAVFFTVVIVGNAGALLLHALRPNLYNYFYSEKAAAIPSEIDDALELMTFEIKYPDNYYMDLDFATDAEMCFSVINNSGETAYSVVSTSVSERNCKLYLKPGTYTVYFSDYPGGQMVVIFVLD